MSESPLSESASSLDGKTQHLRLPKKLIVCCDGTWMDSDNGWTKGQKGQPGKLQNPSNVTRIARAIKPEDANRHPQIVYYQAGVGTGLGLYDQLLGGGTGMGLSEHIREAYAFLANNYYPGEGIRPNDKDSIFLVGFSRGAFTARSLGGFIGAVGILNKKAMPYFYAVFSDWSNAGSDEYEPMFWQAYCDANPDLKLDVKKIAPAQELSRQGGSKAITAYMKEYLRCLQWLDLTREATINAIGVFDTVGALGIPVNPWIQKLFGLPPFIKTYSWFDTCTGNHVLNAYQALALDEQRVPYSPAVWQVDKDGTTNLKQVWFPGAHSNVGGSYNDYGITNITLAWMMDQLSGKTSNPAKDATFDPTQWIEFDEDYITTEAHRALNYYRTAPRGNHYQSWSLGMIYHSCLFPQSLAGAGVRTPGLYHLTNYKTGKALPGLLTNTHEYIHSCVRTRIDKDGRDIEYEDKTFSRRLARWWRWITGRGAKVETYKPHRRATRFERNGPLHWWRLEDGHESHHVPNGNILAKPGDGGDVRWVYEEGGPEKPVTRIMEEASMAEGGFEQKLLSMDAEISKEMEAAGPGWRLLGELKMPHKFASTF